jgi:hypothetical protein
MLQLKTKGTIEWFVNVINISQLNDCRILHNNHVFPREVDYILAAINCIFDNY